MPDRDPPAFFHVASESPEALKVDGAVAGLYGRVVREAGALFGASHYPEYHFLITCSDDPLLAPATSASEDTLTRQA